MSSFTDPLKYENTGHFLSGRPVYRLIEPFDYIVGSVDNLLTYTIHVPNGFLTDLASIPWPVNLILHPDGPWTKAAVVHDYLYKMHDWDYTHAAADGVFYEAMLVLKVNKIIAWAFWVAVTLFGKVQTTPLELRWTLNHLGSTSNKQIVVSVSKPYYRNKGV